MGNEKQGRQKNAELQQDVKVSCLKQDIEIEWFCVKQGQGLKASAAHSHPNFSQVHMSRIWPVNTLFHTWDRHFLILVDSPLKISLERKKPCYM